MLAEIKDTRQIPGEGFRRWFTDKDSDLIVWYENEQQKVITGFQLCYNKTNSEKALTWMKNGGFTHTKVDDGESPYTPNMTPILVSDGLFNKNAVADEFKKKAGRLDQELARFVHSKLLEYR